MLQEELAVNSLVGSGETKIYAKEYLYLFAYPLYSIGHIIHNFPLIRGVRNFINHKSRKHNIEKMVTDIIVTDGKRDFPCKLELISDDGLARVKFINRGKTYTTKARYSASRQMINGQIVYVCSNEYNNPGKYQVAVACTKTVKVYKDTPIYSNVTY